MYLSTIISSKKVFKMSRQKKINLLKFLGIIVSGINVVISLMIMLNKYQIRRDKKKLADEGHAPLGED